MYLCSDSDWWSVFLYIDSNYCLVWHPTPVFLPGEFHGQRDKRDWWATVHRVKKSQTQLKWLSMHAHSVPFKFPCYFECI